MRARHPGEDIQFTFDGIEAIVKSRDGLSGLAGVFFAGASIAECIIQFDKKKSHTEPPF